MTIPTTLRRVIDGQAAIDTSGATLGEVLLDITDRHPPLHSELGPVEFAKRAGLVVLQLPQAAGQATRRNQIPWFEISSNATALRTPIAAPGPRVDSNRNSRGEKSRPRPSR